MSLRLLNLYLRSRLTGWALACLVVYALVAWYLAARIIHPDGGLRPGFWLIVAPLLPAVVIAASLRSPFGDTEQTASRSVPLLRAGHLIGLLICGGLALYGTTPNPASADLTWGLTRNLIGYTGLALLGSRLLGSGIAWAVPLGYAAVALLLDSGSRFGWPSRLEIDRWSVAVALVLFVLGSLAVILRGTRIDPGEAE